MSNGVNNHSRRGSELSVRSERIVERNGLGVLAVRVVSVRLGVSCGCCVFLETTVPPVRSPGEKISKRRREDHELMSSRSRSMCVHTGEV